MKRKEDYIKRKCFHRKTEKLSEYRKNYPFGRKSKPVFSFKRIYGERCLNCGDVNKLK